MEKPFSPSCERNHEIIYETLLPYLKQKNSLLEVASGTGQHYHYMKDKLEWLKWTCSDVLDKHAGIKMWTGKDPILYEIGKNDFLKGNFDCVFCANTVHIISWKLTKTMIKQLGKATHPNTQVYFYGPFKYHGKFTSNSNEDFDKWLKSRDEKSGIRNFEDITVAMSKAGFSLLADHKMPANNQLLVFEK